MHMYAVIKTGGKQYKVTEGEFLKVEKLEGEIGDSIEFAEILMVGGEKTVVGAPLVAGASVTAKIAVQGKGKKDRVFNISESLTEDLKNQVELQKKNNQEYLFTGPDGNLSSRNFCTP